MRESEAWTQLDRYLNDRRDTRLSMTYFRLGREWVWQFVLYLEKGNLVVARNQAGERKAALEGLVEKLNV